jgi:hypothetical protein
MPAAVQRERLPRESGGWTHLRRVEGVLELSGGFRNVDGPLHPAMQSARREGELDVFGSSRSAHLGQHREVAQSGQRQDVFQRAIRGLLHFQCRVHPSRIEMQVQLIVTDTTGALRNDSSGGVLQREEMCVAVHDQRRRLSREGSAQLECLDRHFGDVGMWDREVAWLLLGLAHRGAFDMQTRHGQTLHLDMARQQRQRRPSQRDVLRGQPDAFIVAQLQSLQVERGRERAGELRQLDVTVGKPCGEALDEPAAPVGVARDEQGCEQQHHEEHETPQRPRRDFQHAAHQKACPSPM